MPFNHDLSNDLLRALATYRRDNRQLPAFESLYLNNIASALRELESADLPGEASVYRDALTQNFHDNYYFAEDFKKLNVADLLNHDTFMALLPNIRHSAELSQALLLLNAEGIYSQFTLSLLAQTPAQAIKLAQGLIALNQAKLFNESRARCLLENPGMIASVILLSQRELLDEPTWLYLRANLSDITKIKNVLCALNHNDHLNSATLPVIKLAAQHPTDFSQAIYELGQTLHFDKYIGELQKQAQHSASLASALFNFTYGETPITEPDMNLLFKFPKHADKLSCILISLSHAKDLQQRSRDFLDKLLTQHPEQADAVFQLIDKLKESAPCLFKPENIGALCRHASSAGDILKKWVKPENQRAFDVMLTQGHTNYKLNRILGFSFAAVVTAVGMSATRAMERPTLVPTPH